LARAVLGHLFELDQRLTVVALRPVRLADPVLGVPRQRMPRVLRDEVDEVQHGLSVLARPERGQRRSVLLLRIATARRGRRERGWRRGDARPFDATRWRQTG